MKWERLYKGSIYETPGDKPILSNKEIGFYRKQTNLTIRFFERNRDEITISFKIKNAFHYKEYLKSIGCRFDNSDKTWNYSEYGPVEQIEKILVGILSISRDSGWLATCSGRIPYEFQDIALGKI